MKIKVRFFDKALIREYLSLLAIANLIVSFVLIAVEIPKQHKAEVGLLLALIFSFLYITLWFRANIVTGTQLKINNSTIYVKVGDIFEETGLKVIAFNEYFDTQVDNKIISEKTLNGMYVNKFVQNVGELDRLINEDTRLAEKSLGINDSRQHGKNNRYKLGTIYEHNDYLLTAFSKFDGDNRAYLHMNDYINFLLHFWNEVDIVYGGRSMSLPLMGSGITRFKDYDMITDQELLELLIWSFKISRIKFTYPSKVTIMIHESRKDKINFYRLKEVI